MLTDFYTSFITVGDALRGRSSIHAVLETTVSVVFWVMVSIAALAILEVPLYTLAVSLGSLLVGMSFAISDAVNAATAGFVFVFFRRPYEVGDKVMVTGIADGEHRECCSLLVSHVCKTRNVTSGTRSTHSLSPHDSCC